MPFQMIASLTEDAFSFLKCSRRKIVTPPTIAKNASPDYDADDESKSTEPGDLSCDELSDRSEHAAGSTDGSDAEAPTGQKKSAQLRQSIRSLKQSLEQWEANGFRDQQDASGPLEDHALLALREALSRLTPQGASMVQASLRAKAEQPASSMANSLVSPVQMAAAAPVGSGTVDPNQLMCQGHSPRPQFPSGQLDGDEPSTKPGSRCTGGRPMQQQDAVRLRGKRSSRLARGAPRSESAIDDRSECLPRHSTPCAESAS